MKIYIKKRTNILATCFGLLYIAFVFWSGDPKSDNFLDEQEEWSKDKNVFVTGFEEIQDNYAARLWKNGIIQNVNEDKDSSAFYSVFVSNNDVYTAGYVTMINYDTGTLPMGYSKAMLWKNNKRLNLNYEGKYNISRAVSVFVE